MLKSDRFWGRFVPRMQASGKYLFIVGLGSTLALLIALAPSTAQSSPEIGWEFLGSRELNQAEIRQIEYRGECPGQDSSPQEAQFTSSETPPAPRRRVIVKNITRGVSSDPYPYTDRKYNRGRSSEATEMIFGTSHGDRYFRVLEGENEFEYEIRERKRVIDSGKFTAVIKKNLEVRQRDAIVTSQPACINSSVPLSVCADVRTRIERRCPNQPQALYSYFRPDYPETYTLISNQTPSTIKFRINGRRERLGSGQQRRYRTYSRESLKLEFKPCQSGCFPQTRTLNPARRYRFSRPPFSDYIRFEDDPRPYY